jgi:hypothetical protein
MAPKMSSPVASPLVLSSSGAGELHAALDRPFPSFPCGRDRHRARAGQVNQETGAAELLALGHLDPPAVLDDDLLHDREPQTGAVLLRREIRIEDALPRLGRNAGPVVFHGDHRPLAFAARADDDMAEDPLGLVGALSLVRVADRLHRVSHEIHQHAPEHLAIDRRRKRLTRDVEANVHVVVQRRRLVARCVLQGGELIGRLAQELAQLGIA